MMTETVYSEPVPGTVQTEAHQLLASFWTRKTQEIRTMTDFKTQELPLARIKKIMKQDEEVKMISAEAPVLFAKAAEIFINELSLRAWVHTEDNKRRTLQRNDIAMAITKYDMFDFLIDIVPRDDLKPNKRQEAMRHTIMAPQEQVQYYFQLAHQYQQQQPHTVQTAPTQAQPLQVGAQQQAAIIGAIAQPQQGAVVVTMASGQQLIQTQPHDQNEVAYQIPFANAMPYINRIQQMASVQQLQQQQQPQPQQQGQQPTQQTQQQAVTVQVQGVVTSQAQVVQAQQQVNTQAQAGQQQVQVATQEAQQQAANAGTVGQTTTQPHAEYAQIGGQIYQIQAATGQGATQQVYIAAAAPDQTQQAQQTQAAQPTQQTQATDTDLSQSAGQQQSQ